MPNREIFLNNFHLVLTYIGSIAPFRNAEQGHIFGTCSVSGSTRSSAITQWSLNYNFGTSVCIVSCLFSALTSNGMAYVPTLCSKCSKFANQLLLIHIFLRNTNNLRLWRV